MTPENLTASIAWSPNDSDRLLIAGDESSIETIRVILATLPATARGQVFVEVQSEADLASLVAPGRFSVCWLVRDRGQSLTRSLEAWMSEMLPVSAFEENTVYAWIASEGAARLLSSN